VERELYGNINLDTISNKTHLFGLGPVENLAGEISEFMYMGQKADPSMEESKDGIIGQKALKIKIEAELIKHPELKEYR
jgi:hypothetical protein